MGRTSVASGVDVLGCNAPPWHWAQARLKTALALLLELVQLGVRDQGSVEPERIASASVSTPGDENSVCWKAARSSSIRAGGSTVTCA